MAAEIAVWKHSTIGRAVWNSQASKRAEPEEKITDQENTVRFLLQHPIMFECVSRLNMAKQSISQTDWHTETSQIIRILQ